MKPRAVVDESWPQPDSVALPDLCVRNDLLVLRYLTQSQTIAVASFPRGANVAFGSPNDEALSGHPLYQFGLKHYSVHRIENSPWLQELERRNSIHPMHDRARFVRDKVHYVITFHDVTFECIVRESEGSKVSVKTCDSREEADQLWLHAMGA
jgi:hypothetical protein